MGFVTKDVPVGHPDFGRAFPCTCQREAIIARRNDRIRVLSNLDVVADKTFDTFLLEPPSLTAHQLAILNACYDRALRYADQPEGWLLFQGNYGSGKTHLAAAIANYRMARGDQVVFVTAPDLLDHLRATYGPASETDYDELFERVRSAALLVLDDLGAESPTPWAREKLYQLINHRYLRRLCTIFTTNSQLTDLDPRIRSRLVDWHLTQSLNIQLPDFRRGEPVAGQGGAFTLRLYREMVFETFDLRRDSLPDEPRRNLRKVFEAVRRYAQEPEGWMLLMGPHGSGKTHLAAAVANHRHALGDEVILASVPDLLDYLRAAFSPTAEVSFGKRFDEIKTAPLLVLDQLDLSNASPWAREKMRQIVDHRYLDQLPTVFTTVQPLEAIDPLVRSRLSDTRTCQNLYLDVPDYQGGAMPARRRRPPQ